MGLFGSIGKIFSGAAKAVATGGLSLIAPKLIPKPINALLNQVTSAQFPTSLSSVLKTASVVAAPATGGASITFQQLLANSGGSGMALNIGGILSGVGGILGNKMNLPSIQTAGQLLTLGSSFVQQPAARAVPVATRTPASMGTAVMIRPGALTQEIFNAGNKLLTRLGLRFPATTSGFSSVLRRAIASVASLARRTPAGTVVAILAGLGLTAFESNLLVAWHAQRKRGRRMNPANSKALRRAARRIRSFHKLCTHTDLLRASRRGGSRSVGRCGTCRKSPCRC